LKRKVGSGIYFKISQNTIYEAKFIYKLVQNEAKMLERIFMKLKVFSKKGLKNRESNFTFNPVQNEAKSMLEIKFMKRKLFSKKGS